MNNINVNQNISTQQAFEITLAESVNFFALQDFVVNRAIHNNLDNMVNACFNHTFVSTEQQAQKWLNATGYTKAEVLEFVQKCEVRDLRRVYTTEYENSLINTVVKQKLHSFIKNTSVRSISGFGAHSRTNFIEFQNMLNGKAKN